MFETGAWVLYQRIGFPHASLNVGACDHFVRNTSYDAAIWCVGDWSAAVTSGIGMFKLMNDPITYYAHFIGAYLYCIVMSRSME